MTKKLHGDITYRPQNFAQLRSMSREHMVAILDSLSPASAGGLDINDPKFWYAAIQQRDQEVLNARLLRLTVWVAVLTAVYTVATLLMLWLMLRAA